MTHYTEGRITVYYIRSNELYDTFLITGTGWRKYEQFLRSSEHDCKSVAAFYI